MRRVRQVKVRCAPMERPVDITARKTCKLLIRQPRTAPNAGAGERVFGCRFETNCSVAARHVNSFARARASARSRSSASRHAMRRSSCNTPAFESPMTSRGRRVHLGGLLAFEHAQVVSVRVLRAQPGERGPRGEPRARLRPQDVEVHAARPEFHVREAVRFEVVLHHLRRRNTCGTPS